MIKDIQSVQDGASEFKFTKATRQGIKKGEREVGNGTRRRRGRGEAAAGAGAEADAGSDKARVAPESPAARPDQPGHVRVLTEPKTG